MTNKTIYRCHGCGVYIGDVNDDGTLTIGGLRLVNCDALCPLCGKVVHWRRSDVSLKRLIERLTAEPIDAILIA